MYGQACTGWQDCLSILNYEDAVQPRVVAVSQHLFAIGMSDGTIVMYDDVTCQETYVLQHSEPVYSLIFSEKRTMCASAGANVSGSGS